METITSSFNLMDAVNGDFAESKPDLQQVSDDEDFLPPEPKPTIKHPFQCDVCDRILTTKQSLQFHERTHADPTIRKMFRCEICAAAFKSRNGLSYHLETKHIAGNEREKLPCPTCGRIFKSAEGRKIHMTIQHGAGGPIFKCKACPMVFARKHHLDMHMATHGSGRHVCTICGKSYARLKDLSRHETTCGVKELCCPECGKQLRTAQALENHRKKCPTSGGNQDPRIGEKRRRPRKRDSGVEEAKTRRRRSKYDLFIGLDHLADPSALVEEEKVVKVELKPADPFPKRFPCEHCSLNFASKQAMQHHARRQHWEVLGLTKPAVMQLGRPRKRDSGGEEAKTRRRGSKYDLFIGLEHLADPSALVEEEKVVKVELKPANPFPKRFPCEHCSLNFASKQAMQYHARRRHWEVLGLTKPTVLQLGRPRRCPWERVTKKIGRQQRKVNYVELEELPDEVECHASKEEIDPVKLEDPANREPEVVVGPEAIEQNICVEKKCELIKNVEDPVSDNLAAKEDIKDAEFSDYEFDDGQSTTGEPFQNTAYAEKDNDWIEQMEKSDIFATDKLIIKDESIEFGEYEFNYSKNDSTDDIGEVTFEHVTADLGIPQEPSKEEVDTLDVEPALETNVSEEPHLLKELVIRLEKLDYSVLTKPGSEKHRAKKYESTKTPMTTSAPSYHCEKCDKLYLAEFNFKIHNEKVHGIAGERSLLRPCRHCGKKLRDWARLLKHSKNFHGDVIDESKFVKCSWCRTRFLTEEEMKEHVCYRKVIRLTEFKCDQCPKAFFKESALVRHKNYRHVSRLNKIVKLKSKPKNPFPRLECEHCGKTFAHLYHLSLHRVKEHGSTEVPVARWKAPKTTLSRNFHCDQCDKSYHHEVNLAAHKAKVHGVGVAPSKETKPFKHTCKHCKKQFTGWKALVYHRKFIHGETIDKAQFVQCSSCRSKFTSDEEMAEHLCLKGVIRRTERPFKCDLCEKAYPIRSHLEGHYSVHPEYHNAKCDQCPRGFFSEIWLNKHKKKMHVPKELYHTCETCNQPFKTLENLRRHRELHMGREYCCEHCGKKYKSLANLKSHKYSVHAEYMSEAAQAARMASCTVCGKTYSRSYLKIHMRAHNNDRRFKCSFPSCNKAFVLGFELKVHEQSHTKDYRFKCKFCGYGSVSRKNLQLHEQRKHNHKSITDSQL